MAEGLLQRLAEPATQDQGAATLSGPAAFLYCLVEDAPGLYLSYVTDLYDRGRASLGALAVAPSEGCRSAAINPGRIAPVDWIALASLRDSESEIGGYDASDDTSLPATPPATLAGWFAAAGYRQVRNEADPFFSKGRKETAQLQRLYLQGRRVCLFISADMLTGCGDRVRTLQPNQWAVLAAPVHIMAETVAITLYEWGTTRRVPPNGWLPLDRFHRNFYGFVTAMFPGAADRLPGT